MEIDDTLLKFKEQRQFVREKKTKKTKNKTQWFTFISNFCIEKVSLFILPTANIFLP